MAAVDIGATLKQGASLFFKDQWRVRRNLNLNYGLRYEMVGVPVVTNGLSIQPLAARIWTGARGGEGHQHG